MAATLGTFDGQPDRPVLALLIKLYCLTLSSVGRCYISACDKRDGELGILNSTSLTESRFAVDYLTRTDRRSCCTHYP